MHILVKQFLTILVLFVLAIVGISFIPAPEAEAPAEVPHTQEVPRPPATTTPPVRDETPSDPPPAAPEEPLTPEPPAVPPPPPEPEPQTPPQPTISLELPPLPPIPSSAIDINTRTREAAVNVFCTTQSGGAVRPSSGSGVFVDDQGIILTNAHVAQIMLLKDYQVPDFATCTIRQGSPAINRYHAELLYISPQWISDNRTAIRLTDPKGNGKNDFALLRVTETTNGNPLPDTFPAVAFTTSHSAIEENKPVLVVSYPAGFIGSSSIVKSLYLVSSPATTEKIFTFGGQTPDVISVGGPVVAQKGSSGGAVVDGSTGVLDGIVVTSTHAQTTAERDLRAITLSHIDQSLREDTGEGIAGLLSGDLTAKAAVFNANIAPTLTNILVSELEK